MSPPSRPFDFTRLSLTERILLVEELWDGIAAEQDFLPLSPGHRRELRHRLEIADSGDMTYLSWEDVKARVFRSE